MVINILYWKDLSREERELILQRSTLDIDRVRESVARIVNEVRDRGDDALREFSIKFDHADLAELPLLVADEEYRRAEESLTTEIKSALDYCMENVRSFHSLQKPKGLQLKEIRPGISVGEVVNPIDSVGIYTPRGRGRFPSMLYMSAIPAQIAGVPKIYVVTPPDHAGDVDPATLYVAAKCGVDGVFRVGGAHSLAALAFGTGSLPSVSKLIGPGSTYIAAAKALLAGKVDVGMTAGPSEAVIVADGAASAERVALDLMIEAEHGEDSAALLLTPSGELASEVVSYLKDHVEVLPEPRRGFIKAVLSKYGGVVITSSLDEALELANLYAPEHLQLQTKDPFDDLKKVESAGEVLLGGNTPFSVANYAAGANAILPTGGGARTNSALSVRSFVKYTSVVFATPTGLEGASESVLALADYEGFTAHGAAIRKRPNG